MNKDNMVTILSEVFLDHKLATRDGILEMSKAVIGARNLGKSSFRKFCKEIGLTPDSSIILGLEDIDETCDF